MRAEIFWIEGVPGGRLAVLPRPRGGDWLSDEVRSLRACGVDVLVSLLTREEVAELDLDDEPACCAGCVVGFLSFPFADRGVPESDSDALGLVRSLGDLLAGGQAVAIHCRQGIGRSAVVAACLLASLGERPEEALERIARARGRPVPDTVEQRQWVLRFADRHLKTPGSDRSRRRRRSSKSASLRAAAGTFSSTTPQRSGSARPGSPGVGAATAGWSASKGRAIMAETS